jgi:hypothetical protein
MSRFVACLLLAALPVACKRHTTPVAEATAPSAEAAPPSPRAPGFLKETSGPIVVSDTGNVDATLAQLSLELRRYVLGTRSVPKSFAEFAAKSGLQAPPPPSGNKYAIRGHEVVLVKE